MLTGIVALNLLCLAAAAVALRRVIRPVPSPDATEGFAGVLAAAQPVARRMLGVAAGDGARGPRALPPAASAPVEVRQRAEATRGDPAGAPLRSTPGEDERVVGAVGLADRLAVPRHMLQGIGPGEAAQAAGVTPDSAQALDRVYRRSRSGPC